MTALRLLLIRCGLRRATIGDALSRLVAGRTWGEAMTDRELLEAAAKAAGIKVNWREAVECLCYSGSPYNVAWNPLTDDGDALRLAVSLKIDIGFESFGDESVMTSSAVDAFDGWFDEPYASDPQAATRRAIVRAAAAMGAA